MMAKVICVEVERTTTYLCEEKAATKYRARFSPRSCFLEAGPFDIVSIEELPFRVGHEYELTLKDLGKAEPERLDYDNAQKL